MGSSMFSLTRSAIPISTNERQLIRKLTVVRVSGYKAVAINQEFTKQEYDQLPLFIIELANKILKVNLINGDGPHVYNEISAHFKKIMHQLSHAHLILVHCAAQLLQYYTVICDLQFTPKRPFHDWLKFLSDNREKFGATNNNIFITEYSLILIYNDLCALADTYHEGKDSSNTLNRVTNMATVAFLAQHLTQTKEQIKHWQANAPKNIFIRYLMFIQHYAAAKLLELRYLIEEKQLSDEAKQQLVDAQNECLGLAQKSLDTLATIQQQSEEHAQQAEGEEYTLGNKLFSKFPEMNIDRLREQIANLLSA